MKSSNRTLVLLAAAAAVLSLSSAAFAQDHPPAPTDAQRAAWRQNHEHLRQEHEQERAKKLHDLLNLRPDQEPALQAFLADMRPPPPPEERDHGDRARLDALSTPERLDRMGEMMARRDAEHQAEFRHHAEAVKRFYTALDPAQRRAFDAIHEGGGEHHGWGHEGPDNDGPDHRGPGGPEGPGERG